MKWSLAVLLCICGQAQAQINSERGTIVVAAYTQTQITVAADSRKTNAETGAYVDDDCKIITLGNKVVVGTSGQRSFDASSDKGVKLHWDSHEAARRAFDAAKSKAIESIANEWASYAVDTFNKIAKAGASNQRWRKNVADAVFAGFDDVGRLAIFMVRIRYTTSSPMVAKSEIIPYPPPINSYKIFGFGSDTSILTEFNAGRSDRAKTGRAPFIKELSRLVPDDAVIAQYAAQMAKWTVLYSGDKEIGGPIDYVILNRSGVTDHRKEKCNAADKKARKRRNGNLTKHAKS